VASEFFDLWILYCIAIMAAIRGIRGAITVEADEPELILSATRELLESILRANDLIEFDDVISAIFTTTADLLSTFPAEAARRMGMGQVPLLCAQEIPVPGSMPRCIRVLIHANTDRTPAEIRHVYLRNAQNLRPDMKSAQ
jgi:chorismate mutase